MTSLLKAVSHPIGIFPLCFADVCCGPAASRAEDGCLLVSRSPFDAVLQGHVHSWVRTKYQ